MKTIATTSIFFFVFCSAMSAQTFPYDIDARGKQDTISTIYHLHRYSDHLQVFGLDTVTVEVYFEQRKYTKRPDSSLMSYRSECGQTFLLDKSIAAGSYIYPITRKDGRYILYFFRNGCFVQSNLETLPDDTMSVFFRIWGDCQPPKMTTRI